MTAGRNKATMRKLADALADQEFRLKDKLVEARKAADLEQVDIAQMIGVDKSTISRFERLDSNPTLSMIRNYAYAVGCLVKHDVVPFPEPQPDERMTHLMRLLNEVVFNPPIPIAASVPVHIAVHRGIGFEVSAISEPSPIQLRRADFSGSGGLRVLHMTGISQ
ncbi:helix-turn-helix transcriptional regulator [Nocardia sp. CA-119907]|uniref:helix-turn-helix transcriptional regulator n=1 Tax=Nocardia sp. CA-119907 TaxID=3239973 RepID=UPI003D981DDC